MLRAAYTRAASCMHTCCKLHAHVLRAAYTRAASCMHTCCIHVLRGFWTASKTNHLYEFIGEVILKIDLV